jgi:integrase/recombinase XerC
MRSIRPAQAILGDDLLRDFARGLEERDLSPVTARGYRHDLDRFREWFEQSRGGAPKGVPLSRITAVDLINYRQHLVRAERLEATTINRKVQALKKLFRWARESGQVKADVSVDQRFLPLGQRLRPPGLTEAEVQALLRAAGQTRHGLAKRNYALVTLLVETGLRVGEVCQLRRGDLEVRDRSGRVRVREGKGRKAREVPLNSNARRALRLYLAERAEPQPEDPVFLSERGGKPLALRTFQATIGELGQRARIRRLPVTPHLMRHTFALRYLNPASCSSWLRCWDTNPWTPPLSMHGPPPTNWPPVWRRVNVDARSSGFAAPGAPQRCDSPRRSQRRGISPQLDPF